MSSCTDLAITVETNAPSTEIDKSNNKNKSNKNEDDEDDEDALIDSLPYIDYLDENYEAYALSLVEEEMRRAAPDPRRLSLDHLPNPLSKRTSEMFSYGEGLRASATRNEFRDLVRRNGAKRRRTDGENDDDDDAVRETFASPPPGALDEDEHAWKAAVRSARLASENARARLADAEVGRVFDARTWRTAVAGARGELRAAEAGLASRRAAVDAINAERKDRQEQEVADHLFSLNDRYEELLQSVLTITASTKELKRQIADANKKKAQQQ